MVNQNFFRPLTSRTDLTTVVPSRSPKSRESIGFRSGLVGGHWNEQIKSVRSAGKCGSRSTETAICSLFGDFFTFQQDSASDDRATETVLFKFTRLTNGTVHFGETECNCLQQTFLHVFTNRFICDACSQLLMQYFWGPANYIQYTVVHQGNLSLNHVVGLTLNTCLSSNSTQP